LYNRWMKDMEERKDRIEMMDETKGREKGIG
jgi:hypothetical protein